MLKTESDRLTECIRKAEENRKHTEQIHTHFFGYEFGYTKLKRVGGRELIAKILPPYEERDFRGIAVEIGCNFREDKRFAELNYYLHDEYKKGTLQKNPIMLDGSQFIYAKLDGQFLPFVSAKKVNFFGANFSRSELVQADLSGSYLRHATLRKAKLMQSKLVNSFLQNSDLTEACLKEANLTKADISCARCKHADFSGANITRLIYSGADIEGAQFKGAICPIKDFVGIALPRSTLKYKKEFVEPFLEEVSRAGRPKSDYVIISDSETEEHIPPGFKVIRLRELQAALV